MVISTDVRFAGRNTAAKKLSSSPAKENWPRARNRSVLGLLHLLHLELGGVQIVIQRVLRRGRTVDRLVSEPSAPGERVRNQHAVLRHLGGDMHQVTLLGRIRIFLVVRAPVRVFEREAQARLAGRST